MAHSGATRASVLRGFLATILSLLTVAAATAVPVRSITFEGNQHIDSRRLKSQLRQCREGGWYEPDTLAADVQNLTRFYQDEGYLNARIGPASIDFQTDRTEGRVAVIRVPVFEGPLFTVGKIEVKGAQAFNPATLLQMCPLRSGQPYSRKRIADWLERIGDGYSTMGYIRFHPSVHEVTHDAQASVDCIIECMEGSAYSVGKITVVGDDSINLSEFKRRLLLGEGGLYNPEMLSLSLQFLNQMGTYMPIRESQVEVKIDDARTTVDLTFHVSLRRK